MPTGCAEDLMTFLAVIIIIILYYNIIFILIIIIQGVKMSTFMFSVNFKTRKQKSCDNVIIKDK